jgi:uncharacterized protein YbaP (TraB family)
MLGFPHVLLAGEPAGPFLWRIETSGKPVYLFGTNHQLPLQAVDSAVTRAMAQSPVVMFEADNSESSDKYPDLVWLPRDQSLDEMLGPRLWSVYTANADSSWTPDHLKRLRPSMAMALLRPRDSGVPATGPGMDEQLEEAARADGKTIAYLESGEQHYRFADRAFTVEALADVLNHLDAASPDISSAKGLYLSGDEATWSAFNARMNALESPRVRQILIDERNRAWLPRIEERIRTGGVFIAAGINHFIADGTLIADLERKGYRISRVASEAGAVTAPAGAGPIRDPAPTASPGRGLSRELDSEAFRQLSAASRAP